MAWRFKTTKEMPGYVNNVDSIITPLGNEIAKQFRNITCIKYHPQHPLVCTGIRIASDMLQNKILELAETITDKNYMGMLLVEDIAKTYSKRLGFGCHEFAKCLVDAVLSTHAPISKQDDEDDEDDEDYDVYDEDIDVIEIGKAPVHGDNATNFNSFLVKGIVFKSDLLSLKNHVSKPKILLIDIKLNANTKRNIDDIVDKCVKCGVQVLISVQAVDDGVKQCFAKKGIICGSVIDKDDMYRISVATQSSVLSNFKSLTPKSLGTCNVFKVKKVGAELLNILEGFLSRQTVTIVFHGHNQIIDQARSDLPNLIMYVRKAMENSTVVAGGHVIYTQLKEYLLQEAKNVHINSQPFIKAFATALEVLSSKHQTGIFLREPTVKVFDGIKAASEMACMILTDLG